MYWSEGTGGETELRASGQSRRDSSRCVPCLFSRSLARPRTSTSLVLPRTKHHLPLPSRAPRFHHPPSIALRASRPPLPSPHGTYFPRRDCTYSRARSSASVTYRAHRASRIETPFRSRISFLSSNRLERVLLRQTRCCDEQARTGLRFWKRREQIRRLFRRRRARPEDERRGCAAKGHRGPDGQKKVSAYVRFYCRVIVRRRRCYCCSCVSLDELRECGHGRRLLEHAQ